MASVIIPAYNEEANIARGLRSLTTSNRSTEIEVVVAANGCHDSTVTVARGFPGVRVLDIPEPSKVRALNTADEQVDTFPRIYMDADVVLADGALDAMIDALTTDEVRLCAPSVQYDTSGADPLVRGFYATFVALPSATESVVGRGVFGLSRAARARFTDFPELLGDDLFVTRLFDGHETCVVPGTSVVRAPRTWRDLLKVRTRIAAGNAQLAVTREGHVGDLAAEHDFSPTTKQTLRALAALVRREPSRMPAIGGYVAITLMARVRARGATANEWQRDTSTR